MTHDMLKTVFESADAKEKDGWFSAGEDRLFSLYAAHDGVSLTIQKIETLKHSHGILHARNAKGETFLLALEDVFAVAFDGGSSPTTVARKAGFLG